MKKEEEEEEEEGRRDATGERLGEKKVFCVNGRERERALDEK